MPSCLVVTCVGMTKTPFILMSFGQDIDIGGHMDASVRQDRRSWTMSRLQTKVHMFVLYEQA